MSEVPTPAGGLEFSQSIVRHLASNEHMSRQPSIAISMPQGRREPQRSDAATAHWQSMPASPSSPPSLLGSYKASLFSGRMSSAPSHPIQFQLIANIIGFPPCPPSLKSRPKLNIPFEARYYEMHGPWVANIDLLSPRESSVDSEGPPVNNEHGLRVSPHGQLQVIIQNHLGTTLKLLLVPYNVSDMPPGTRTYLRRVWYAGNPGRIVYAVHLQFVCTDSESEHSTPSSTVPPAHSSELLFEMDAPKESPKRRRRSNKKLYLSRDIKLIFASKAPDPDEEIRQENEGSGGYYPWQGWAPRSPSTERHVHHHHQHPHKRRRSSLSTLLSELDSSLSPSESQTVVNPRELRPFVGPNPSGGGTFRMIGLAMPGDHRVCILLQALSGYSRQCQNDEIRTNQNNLTQHRVSSQSYSFGACTHYFHCGVQTSLQYNYLSVGTIPESFQPPLSHPNLVG
ncbi:hypothetical protein SISNIDRAFT_485690 [Sistotremastrum niveocremeum HHB9708]|uniref:Atos-like conserved domain-containing protein n=1 Tax=Sistotremastrum niveocremeum HHB9708 TaxID=1314777 RepID=A0A164UQ54_9AGAM|nr:hypothetical protein SISNIDRAFT_485690 [Sistotremastrum niveocremeum HHB9708]